MPIKIEQWITRQDVQNHPDWLYVWGDNLAQAGLGGQAKACRGEPNGVGIPTKRTPSMNENAFFNDKEDYAKAKMEFGKAFARLQKHLDAGGVVVWPAAGIGTGYAQLAERAPKIWALLDRYKAELFKNANE